MTIYWILLLLPGWLALRERPAAAGAMETPEDIALSRRRLQRPPVFWVLAFVVLGLVVGLRDQVGPDWGQYEHMLDVTRWLTLHQSMFGGIEPAYGFLNWFGSHVGGGLYLVNAICGTLFCWGLISFCRIQPRPWLALTVAVPYLIIVVAMGYSRQAVAIGLVMHGLVALYHQRLLRFIVWVLVAATFHKSALILIPLAVFSNTHNRWLKVVGIVVPSLAIFAFVASDLANSSYNAVYFGQKYNSTGAAIRVAMNAVPSALFILANNRLVMSTAQRELWRWMAWGGILLVVALALSPSSTAVDRLALYWIPIQMVVWSRFPDIMGARGQKSPTWEFFVVLYSAVVLTVWLGFGSFSQMWIPYNFYPWDALWH